ncbi:hypothetical protein [Gemmatimonas phototrophica]|nr:hypothetical protein [Gemmatimonas phototrophica]
MIPVDMSNSPSQEPTHSGIGMGPATALWRDRLHRCLASNATPVVLFPDAVRSAASLWAGMRTWTHHLRNAGILAGDVVVCALPSGDGLLQLLLACLWDGISVEIHSPDCELSALLGRVERVDGTVLVVSLLPEMAPPWMHAPANGGWPNESRSLTSRCSHPRQPDRLEEPVVRLRDKRGLTHAELLHAVMEQCRDASLQGRCVLSLVDWHHESGLVGGVLAPLLCAEELFVLSAHDITAIERVLGHEPVSHVLVGSVDEQRFRQVLTLPSHVTLRLC